METIKYVVFIVYKILDPLVSILLNFIPKYYQKS